MNSLPCKSVLLERFSCAFHFLHQISNSFVYLVLARLSYSLFSVKEDVSSSALKIYELKFFLSNFKYCLKNNRYDLNLKLLKKQFIYLISIST